MSLPALVGTLARLLTLGTTVDRLTTFYNVEPGLLQPSPTISASKVRFPNWQNYPFIRSTVHSLIFEPATVAAILPRATLHHNKDMDTTKALLYVVPVAQCWVDPRAVALSMLRMLTASYHFRCNTSKAHHNRSLCSRRKAAAIR